MNHPFRIAEIKMRSEDPASGSDEAEVSPTIEADHAQRAAAEEAERVRLRKAAVDEGYEEGMRRGHKEAFALMQTSIGTSLQKIEETIARLDKERIVGQEAMTRAAITIGTTLAELLIGASVTFDREGVIHNIMEQARCEAAYGDLPLIFRAAPETIAGIRAVLPDSVTIVEDMSMKAGGFIVELMGIEGGNVINRWDASVERMERVIHDMKFNV